MQADFVNFTSYQMYRKVKKGIILGVLLATGLTAFAQEETVDQKANTILQSLDKKMKSYKSIKADFTIITYDRDKKQTDNQKGSLTSRGGKYKLDIKNQTVFCDSTTTWTYLKDANEVQINNVDHSDKSSLTPENIFTFYENGFKSHFESETKSGNYTLAVIDLYPKHPEKEKYHTLKVTINKEKNQITEVKVMMKDGTTAVWSINAFTPNADVSASTFTFNAKDYPGVEVEDLRN